LPLVVGEGVSAEEGVATFRLAQDGFFLVGNGGAAELEESPAAHVAGRFPPPEREGEPGAKHELGGGSFIQGNQLESSLLLI
jgi:hypothetical protein